MDNGGQNDASPVRGSETTVRSSAHPPQARRVIGAHHAQSAGLRPSIHCNARGHSRCNRNLLRTAETSAGDSSATGFGVRCSGRGLSSRRRVRKRTARRPSPRRTPRTVSTHRSPAWGASADQRVQGAACRRVATSVAQITARQNRLQCGQHLHVRPPVSFPMTVTETRATRDGLALTRSDYRRDHSDPRRNPLHITVCVQRPWRRSRFPNATAFKCKPLTNDNNSAVNQSIIYYSNRKKNSAGQSLLLECGPPLSPFGSV